MSKGNININHFENFVNSLANSELNLEQQVLISVFGGRSSYSESGSSTDVQVNNTVQGCSTTNNCNKGNCVAGCGAS